MDTLELATRICTDPALEPARAAAREQSRLDWQETQALVLAEDRAGLARALGRDTARAATLMHADMHARVCPDCADIEAILAAGAAALAGQALDWYGFWAGLRQNPAGPMPADMIARWLATNQPAILARLPAALDAIGAA